MNNKVVLVVAAHTDDEALGCAGTIAKHIANGDDVHLLFMTDGVGSRLVKDDEVVVRSLSAKKAAKLLGVKSFKNLNFPDNKMDSIPLIDIVKEIESKITELRPQVIYTHHIGDLNIDHQITHKALITACRPQPGFSVKEIYAFEVLSSTEWQTPNVLPFIANVFIDISIFIDKKIAVLEAYGSEMRDAPHSRSIINIKQLCGLRGNSVGCDYAEAFMLLRSIQ